MEPSQCLQRATRGGRFPGVVPGLCSCLGGTLQGLEEPGV